MFSRNRFCPRTFNCTVVGAATAYGSTAVVAKMPAAYQNPNSWIVTGTKGIFAYPRGEPEPDDVVEKSISAAGKIILQSLLRLVLGI